MQKEPLSCSGGYFMPGYVKTLKRACTRPAFPKKHTRPLQGKIQLSPSLSLARDDVLEWWEEANGQFRSAHSTHSAADFSTVKRADSLSHTRDGCPLCLTVGETFISKTFPVCVRARGIRIPSPNPLHPWRLSLFLGSPLSPIPWPHNVSGSFMQIGCISTLEKYSLKGQSHLFGPLKSPHTAGTIGFTAPLFATKKPPP